MASLEALLRRAFVSTRHGKQCKEREVGQSCRNMVLGMCLCRNIFVLGSGYSGTSAITAEVRRMGWRLGHSSQILQDYLEDKRLVAINSVYLNKTGLLGYETAGPESIDRLAARFAGLGRQLISEAPGPLELLRTYALAPQQTPFVWKDPRLIFTLHLWHPVLAHPQNITSGMCKVQRHTPRLRNGRAVCRHATSLTRKQGLGALGPSARLPLVLSVTRNLTLMRRSYLRRAGISAAQAAHPLPQFNGLTIGAHIALKEAWRRWQFARWPGPKLEISLSSVRLPKKNVDSREPPAKAKARPRVISSGQRSFPIFWGI